LTDYQLKQIEGATKDYEAAKARGDAQGMADAHAFAEKIRSQAAGGGYSGGTSGKGYLPKPVVAPAQPTTTVGIGGKTGGGTGNICGYTISTKAGMFFVIEEETDEGRAVVGVVPLDELDRLFEMLEDGDISFVLGGNGKGGIVERYLEQHKHIRELTEAGVFRQETDDLLAVSEYNYIMNSSSVFNGLICDQKSGNAASMLMGYFDSTWNGCGWVATYNALYLLGLKQEPAEIIRYYETHNGLVLNGLFGVKPQSVVEFFNDQKGVTADSYFRPKSPVDDSIKGSTVSIVNYLHDSGMHYITVEYDSATDTFYTMNTFDNEKDKIGRGDSIDVFFNLNDYVIYDLITISDSTTNNNPKSAAPPVNNTQFSLTTQPSWSK
jgi:hypothetical protein